MSHNFRIRWRWLRFVYIYTFVGAGGCGVAMLCIPHTIQSTLGFPVQDPVVFGAYASVLIAFGIGSLLGLRSPLKFAPLLFMQLCFKSIWLIGVLLPLFIAGQFPGHAFLTAIIFVSSIVGDLVALSFSYILMTHHS
ncbi:MAG: hypothetical protein JSV84_14830 [Gemmatimonadota bacterium]|nr:MAG: hypothetical protein JSV84_14830 [Gemmatimonadota bacterium]